VAHHTEKTQRDLEKTLDAITPSIKAFGLSGQEARLVQALASGATLKQAANAIGVKYETARGYLKSIFAKTNCNSQTALVLKIHRELKNDISRE